MCRVDDGRCSSEDDKVYRPMIRSLYQNTKAERKPSDFHDLGTFILLTLRFLVVTAPLLLRDLVSLLLCLICILPALVRCFWFYNFAANRRAIRYGDDSCRQSLDVYDSQNEKEGKKASGEGTSSGKPVLLYFPGGAWMIGYKVWGCMMARTLAESGAIVVIADYRNYPTGFVPDQLEDVETVMQWTLDNIHKFGGDPDNVFVAGESAGGHLSLTVLLRLAMHKKLGVTSPRSSNVPTFEATDFKGFISTASPYDIVALEKSFATHGIETHHIDYLFDGWRQELNTIALVQECNQLGMSLDDVLPPLRMYQGEKDETVLHSNTEAFVEEIKKTNVSVKLTTYEGFGHTRAGIEGPMDGDHRLQRDMCNDMNELMGGEHVLTFPDDEVFLQRFCPSILIGWGSYLFPM